MKNLKELEIIVIGKSKTYKSTTAKFLQENFKEFFNEVKLIENDCEITDLKQRLENLKKVNLTIKTKNI